MKSTKTKKTVVSFWSFFGETKKNATSRLVLESRLYFFGDGSCLAFDEMMSRSISDLQSVKNTRWI